MAVWRGVFRPNRHSPSAMWRFMAESAISRIAAATAMAPWRSVAGVAVMAGWSSFFKGHLRTSPDFFS